MIPVVWFLLLENICLKNYIFFYSINALLLFCTFSCLMSVFLVALTTTWILEFPTVPGQISLRSFQNHIPGRLLSLFFGCPKSPSWIDRPTPKSYHLSVPSPLTSKWILFCNIHIIYLCDYFITYSVASGRNLRLFLTSHSATNLFVLLLTKISSVLYFCISNSLSVPVGKLVCHSILMPVHVSK